MSDTKQISEPDSPVASPTNVFQAQHPLVHHHLTYLRDQQTTPAAFRQHLQQLATLLAYEATQDLELENYSVETPLTTTNCLALKKSQRIGLIPILRAGLGMVDPVLNLIPTAEVWHLGMYRDEATAQPVEYYSKIREDQPVDMALVLDPMLATGGSATAALSALKDWGVRELKLLSIIAAQDGIDQVSSQFPEASIYLCSIDQVLNADKFIVPGLGDAGDRIFNTAQ